MKTEAIKQNEAVDEVVFNAVKAGHRRASKIVLAVMGEAAIHEKYATNKSTSYQRIVDGALQRLRRAGRIEFGGNPSGWQVTGGK